MKKIKEGQNISAPVKNNTILITTVTMKCSTIIGIVTTTTACLQKWA